MINEPHGIVLVTGPTGSGKSTTLYNSIRLVDDRSRKIITVEDPVEYKIDGITQIQVKDEIGMSFAAGLRAILRHDPDVIMVGEIRDQETAKIAIQSALTGHMVFSTLHTNDAASAATRLIDMGIEPFLIASALTGVLAQRLLRKLCSCAQPIEIPAIYATAYSEILLKNPRLTANSYRFREAVGCDLCSQTGYSGRMGLFELMKVDEQIRQAIVIKKPATEIAAMAFLAGSARTLFEDGLIKAGMGLTSIEEVCRVAVNAVAEPMQ
ncbi:GspE/PulE family protein [Deefgea sp. CFH1-16]|uniref:GspE/PulE family protein n=1 Tax=Deefgea sp. CFH1-16 TaxID=2675457 RepID=UPI0019403438|nr:GspE/PulE family protein [Deefgea sp. CFH1-16]